MQFRKLFTVMIFSIGALCACKKNNTDPSTAQAKVKTNDRLLLKSAQTYQTYEFQYNSDRTVKSYSWGNGFYNIDFNYPQNKLVYTLTGSGKKMCYAEYVLSGGIAQKFTATYYDANGNITDNYVSDYTYNSKGQMIKEVYSKNGAGMGYTTYTYNTEGDLVSLIYTDANGNLVHKHEYEYYTSLADKSFSFGQFSGNCQGSVFPNKANHLILKDIMTDNSGTKVYTYTYTLDAQGYVLTGIVKDGFGTETESWTNNWQ